MSNRRFTVDAPKRRIGWSRQLIARIVIAVTAVSLIGVATIRTASAAPAPASPSATTIDNTLAGLKLMNYYPANNAWTLMWSNWNATTIAADFQAISALHANAVRLFVSPVVFGWPTPSKLMLTRLQSTVNLAAAAHLKVELTIFDLWPDYNDIASSNTWATAVLTPYANDPEIVFVETRNEVDITNQAEMTWLREQIPFDKRILGTVPVTASVTGSATALAAEMVQLVQAGAEFLDWHYFSPGSPATIYANLLQAKQTAGTMGLFIGEAGQSTYTGNSTTVAVANQNQLTFYESMDWATTQLGLPDAAPWTFSDFTATAIPSTIQSSQSPAEYQFGLRTTTGQLKPAGVLEQSFFATGQAPDVVNGEFAAVGGAVTDWTTYHPTEATFSSAPGVSAGGGSSLEISSSSGDTGGLPSYDTQLPVAPTTTPQTYTVSVSVKGTQAAGVTLVALAWFDGSGRWLGNTSSPRMASGTTAWTQLTATGPNPAGATKVIAYLQSAYNPGAAYFSNLTWSVTG